MTAVPAIDRKAEAARLAAIRGRLAVLDGQDWLRAYDGDNERLEARGPDGAAAVLSRFDSGASEDEKAVICGALDDERFLLGLLDRAILSLSAGASAPASVHGLAHPADACPATEGDWSLASEERAGRKARPAGGPASLPGDQPGVSGAAREARQGKDYAAEAAMKCAEPAFKKYLEECHGLERPLTDERVAARLRHVLGIGSRRELNADAAAARRWRALIGDFEQWRRG